MLRLSKECVLYTEDDFPKFNPEGFERIHNAVEMARQSRDLALCSDTLQEDAMRDANSLLRATSARKILEQQLAQKNFESERDRAYEVLQKLIEWFRKAWLPYSRRPEIENRIDHLITRFNMKDFNAVHREAPEVKRMNNLQLPNKNGPHLPPPSPPPSESITAMFEHGQRLQRKGNLRQAVEVYRKVLDRNPHHIRAKNALKHITEQQRWKSFNGRRGF